MSLDPEKITVASMPPYSSHLPAIEAKTADWLNKAKERTKKDFGQLSVFQVRATVQLVYAGFGFKLMRKEFATEGAWKSFVVKHFPDPDHVKNRNWYVAIGQHFHYDDSYLTFLIGQNYPVPPKELDEKRNIGNQIDALNKLLKSDQQPLIRCPDDLLHWIKNKHLPEVPEPEAKPETIAKSSEAETSTLQVPATGDDYEAALGKMILEVGVLYRARKGLAAIIEKCPVAEFNQDKVATLLFTLGQARGHLDAMEAMLK
jgi:hypothetical protein